MFLVGKLGPLPGSAAFPCGQREGWGCFCWGAGAVGEASAHGDQPWPLRKLSRRWNSGRKKRLLWRQAPRLQTKGTPQRSR